MVLDVNDPDILNIAQKLYDTTDSEYVRNLCDGIIRGEMTVRTLQLEIQQADDEIKKIDEEIRKREIEIQKANEKIACLEAKQNTLKQQKQ